MQSLDIKTKRLESQDVKVAVKIAASFEGIYFTKEALADIASSLKSDTVFTASFDNKLVGFVCCKTVNEWVIELVWMAILKDYQDKGIGTMLIEKAVLQYKGKYKYLKVKTLAPTSDYKPYEKTRKFLKRTVFSRLRLLKIIRGGMLIPPVLS